MPEAHAFEKRPEPKSATSTLLKSSDALGWSYLFAELRTYRLRGGPGPVTPHAKVTLTVRGSHEGPVACMTR